MDLRTMLNDTGGSLPSVKKRKLERPRRYAETPIWARSLEDVKREAQQQGIDFELKSYGFELRNHLRARTNGRREHTVERTTPRNSSPELSRSSLPAPPPPAPPAPPAPPPSAGSRSTLGAWEPTITNKKPQEEMVRHLADFLFFNVINNDHLGEIKSRNIQFEIEAKLGWCIDKQTNERFNLPVATECVLKPMANLAFKSSMDEAQHAHFNQWLNARVQETHHRNREASGRVEVVYKHTREVDKFYELPRELEVRLPGVIRHYYNRSGGRSIKVRVTYSVQKGSDGSQKLVPLRSLVKARIDDIHIHFPSHPLDCRISINLEMPWDGPIDEIEQLGTRDLARAPDRNKDRVSYTHGPYQIDLTQVTQNVTGMQSQITVKKEHELEIELSADKVLAQGDLLKNNAPHNYTDLIEGFIDNVRILVHQA